MRDLSFSPGGRSGASRTRPKGTESHYWGKDVAIVPKKNRPADRPADRKDKSSSLKARIEKAESDFTEPGRGRYSSAGLPAGGLAMVGRIASEMVAGVAVGGFVGWLIDRWLDTLPLFMILLFFVGATSGMLNVWRLATGKGLKMGYADQRRVIDDDDVDDHDNGNHDDKAQKP